MRLLRKHPQPVTHCEVCGRELAHDNQWGSVCGSSCHYVKGR